MSEFLTPRMHDDDRDQAEPEPIVPSEPHVPPQAPQAEVARPIAPTEPVHAPQPMPEAPAVVDVSAAARSPRGPGPLGRLVSLIITVGLAWALTVAMSAWLLGLFLSRG